MAVERWDDERLDRLAQTVEGLVKTVGDMTYVVNGNSRTVQAIADALAEAAEERRELLQLIARQQSEIHEMQSDIRGIQTENRHILDILLNRQNGGD